MTQFNYQQYQQIAAQEQANTSGNGTKVGYFRLRDDGDIAIARINISSTDEFMFAAVHTVQAGGRWLKVSCHNPLGMNGGTCALCSAHQANPKGTISKSAKKLFIPMLVSYRDSQSATGYTPATPVIWDRPAGFSRELANKLMVAGNLKDVLVLITRNGKAGDMQTTYSVDVLPATHPVFKPEMIPADFSAFNNFNIAKHSYWEKTAEEINTFLTTGQFPEVVKTNAQQASTVAQVANTYNTQPVPAMPAYNAPANYVAPNANMSPVTPAFEYTAPAQAAPTVVNTFVPGVTTAPASVTPAAPAATPGTPVRNFSGFNF